MTIVETSRLIVGGVDTHLDVHVAAAVDANGALLGVQSFPTTLDGYHAVSCWLSSFGVLERVGVEGTGTYGAGLARHGAAAPLVDTSCARRGRGGEDVNVPKKFPVEFKRDVVTVARRGDLTINEVAADFDISPESVRRWMRQADIDDGVKDGLTTAEQAELVQLRRKTRRLEMENEILRRAGRVLRSGPAPKKKFPLVLDLAAEGFPVRLTCGVLGFSTQAFYKWRARPCSDRDWANAHSTNVIVDVHADDPEFGYRLIADELEDEGNAAANVACGGSARRSGCGRRPPRRAAERTARRPVRRCTTTWCSGYSPRRHPTWCGSPTSPSTLRSRGSSTAVRSRTCSRTASSATRSANA